MTLQAVRAVTTHFVCLAAHVTAYRSPESLNLRTTEDVHN